MIIPYLLTTYFLQRPTNLSREDPDPAGSVINWPLESGSLNQDYGSADPNQKEIFMDPRNTAMHNKFHLDLYVNLMVSDVSFGLTNVHVGCLLELYILQA
jgi:hypothetical protein